jgi:hypothetical protein
MAGSSDHGNESSSSIQGREILGLLSDSLLVEIVP